MAGLLGGLGNQVVSDEVDDGPVVYSLRTGRVESVSSDPVIPDIDLEEEVDNRRSSEIRSEGLAEPVLQAAAEQAVAEVESRLEGQQIGAQAETANELQTSSYPSRHKILGRFKDFFEYDAVTNELRAVDESSLQNPEYEVAVLDEETGEVTLYTYLADSGVYATVRTFTSQNDYASFLLSRKASSPQNSQQQSPNDERQSNVGSGAAPSAGAKIRDTLDGTASGLVAATGTILKGCGLAAKAAHDALKKSLEKKEQSELFRKSQDAAPGFAGIQQADIDEKIDQTKSDAQRALEGSLEQAATSIEALALNQGLKDFREKMLSVTDPDAASEVFNAHFEELSPEEQEFVTTHIKNIESALKKAADVSQGLAESKVLTEEEHQELLEKVKAAREKIERDLQEKLKNFQGSDQRSLSDLAERVFGKMIGFLDQIGEFIKKTFNIGDKTAQELRADEASQKPAAMGLA